MAAWPVPGHEASFPNKCLTKFGLKGWNVSGMTSIFFSLSCVRHFKINQNRAKCLTLNRLEPLIFWAWQEIPARHIFVWSRGVFVCSHLCLHHWRCLLTWTNSLFTGRKAHSPLVLDTEWCFLKVNRMQEMESKCQLGLQKFGLMEFGLSAFGISCMNLLRFFQSAWRAINYGAL